MPYYTSRFGAVMLLSDCFSDFFLLAVFLCFSFILLFNLI